MRSNKEIRALLDKVLGMVSAPEAVAGYAEGRSLATRFGDNAITQNKGSENSMVSLEAAYGKKHGGSRTNRLDDDGLQELVKRAETVASDSPEDPEYMPPIEPAEYPDVPKGFFESTAASSPEQLADTVSACVERAKAKDMVAAGTFEVSWGSSAIANSRGLYAYDTGSSAEFGTTMHTPDGTGKASVVSENIEKINGATIADEAIDTAGMNRDHAELEPGDYTVILTPQATDGFLEFLFMNLDAREADEGVNVFAGKVGEKLFDERITISSPIDDPELPPPLFGTSGLPVKETVWVGSGVLERLHHPRFWAKEKGTTPDPHLSPIRMEGEDRSFDELVGMCDRGLLVSHLWYIRYVDEKELLLTGMTRDGLFLVENGKITRAVKNFRFNESPVELLKNVTAMSRPERTGSVKVPGILANNFSMSSKTDF